jgi:NAD(P)-dependent dehydrogenase (short-subunit alcohol dehydrogenase family)
MNNQFENKIAVITGGTQGLGAATAELFAARGAEGIIICGRSEAKGKEQVSKLEKLGSRAVFVKADLSVVEDCRKVFTDADRAFGRVDVLVNVAGATDRGTILETSPELFDRLFAINTRAPFFLMQEAITLFRRDKIEGTVVNISTMSSMGGQPFLSAYSASKGALDTLTRNTAYAVLRNRIRVNSLNIGWMASEGEDRTQRVVDGQPDDWLVKAAAQQPNGRLIEPAEVARAIAFLASAESGLMTGAIVNFDQGIWGAYDGVPHPETAL